MSMTLKITDIAPGILRLRLSEKHAQTLAERYKLIELPETLSESGIKVDETAGKITFPDGKNNVLLDDRRRGVRFPAREP